MINYTEHYQNMTAEEIAIITKHCLHKHDSHYYYRKAYFKTHPENNIEDFHDWEFHYMNSDWQDSIWIMSSKDFEYYWPYHSAFIQELYQD
jgi:hypothetical protein